jgi:hypothetical protein
MAGEIAAPVACVGVAGVVVFVGARFEASVGVVSAADDRRLAGGRRCPVTTVEGVVGELDPAEMPASGSVVAGVLGVFGASEEVRERTTMVVAIESPSASHTVVSRSHARRGRDRGWPFEEWSGARGGVCDLGSDMDRRFEASAHGCTILSIELPLHLPLVHGVTIAGPTIEADFFGPSLFVVDWMEARCQQSRLPIFSYSRGSPAQISPQQSNVRCAH